MRKKKMEVETGKRGSESVEETGSKRKLRAPTPGVNEKKGLLFEREEYDKTRPHPPDLSDYETYYKQDSEVHSGVNVLADMSVGVGYYTVSENEKAKEIVDNFAEEVGLDQLLLNSVKCMLVYGFCPVERYLKRGPPKANLQLKILPPKTVKAIMNRKGKLLGYKQQIFGKIVNFKPKEIIWFVYNQVGTDPYGNSLVKSILTLLKAKKQINEDMPKIIHRYAGPLTVWKTKGSVKSIKKAVVQREPDEDIFIGGVEEGDVTHDTLELDPRGRFVDYQEQINQQILEGLQAPLLHYLRNATEASATKMLEVIERHIIGIQRYVKRVVEREIFAPLLLLHGITDVPRVEWGVPKTGLEDLDLGGLADLVNAGAITPTQAQFLIKKMGVPLGEEEEHSPTANTKLNVTPFKAKN